MIIEDDLFESFAGRAEILNALRNGHRVFCSWAYFESQNVPRQLASAIAPNVCKTIGENVTYTENEEGITLKWIISPS